LFRGKKTIASLEESIQKAETNPISQAAVWAFGDGKNMGIKYD
jgi:hypothetical protein